MRATADIVIEISSEEYPEPSKLLSIKPGVGQNIALHTSPTARKSDFYLYLYSSFSLILFREGRYIALHALSMARNSPFFYIRILFIQFHSFPVLFKHKMIHATLL